MYHHYKGYFIVVEGVDGVGKTSAIASVVQSLKEAGVDAVSTSESFDTVDGLDNSFCATLLGMVRQTSTRDQADPLSQSLMINAARRAHYQNVLVPCLEAGKVVIMDRFYLSTFFNYQRDCKKNVELHNIALSNLKPDYTIVLSATSRVAQERMATRRGQPIDYTDERALIAFDDIQEKLVGYVTINPGIVIDASVSKEDVSLEVLESVKYAMDIIDERRVQGTERPH